MTTTPPPVWPTLDEPISFEVDGIDVVVRGTGGLLTPGSAIGVYVNGINGGLDRELHFHVDLHEIDRQAEPTRLLASTDRLTAVPSMHQPRPRRPKPPLV